LRWRRAGHLLRLSSVDASPAVPAFAAQPLTRVGDAPGQRPLENPAMLQGAWVSDPTSADVLAHHDDPNGIAGNTGPLRLTVHGNRCRWTQHAPDGDHWGLGTCRFAGDTLEFDQARPTAMPSRRRRTGAGASSAAG
jgi:hypothetical protein